jgi:Tol biopolymer transport system component
VKSWSRLLWFVFLFGVGIPFFSIEAAQQEPPFFRDVDFLRLISEGRMAEYYLDDPTAVVPPLEPRGPGMPYPPFNSNIVWQAMRDNNWDIYMKDAKGQGDEVRLTSEASAESSPSLKHGAAQVAFVSDRDGYNEIYRVDTAGGNLVNVSQNGNHDFNPAWRWDGSRIAFNSLRTGNSEIFTADANGTNLAQLTNHAAYDGQPSWSRDGNQIVFSSTRTGRYELWVMNADGSNQHQITFGAMALYPAWSPKDDLIAYANDGDGNGWLEIWFIKPDGSGAYQHYPGSNLRDFWLPAWSPDGGIITFTDTSWVFYQGQYYWSSSYVNVADPLQTNLYSTSNIYDNKAWRTSWAALDASPPNPCVVQLPSEQNQSIFMVGWTASDVGDAGIAAYDVEVRWGTTGEWQPFVSDTSNPSARFEGGNGTIQFRCRARDQAFNQGNWGAAVTMTIDTSLPTSYVLPLAGQAQGPIIVQWAGNESNLTYDVFVREGTEGNWEIWQDDVTTTSALFTAGTAGQRYYFRSQAHEGQQLEPWTGTPDAVVTYYAHTISGVVQDNRGYPVVEPAVELTPSALDMSQDSFTGMYELFVGASGSYTLTFSAEGYGSLPATMLPLSGNTTYDAFLFPSDDGVVNGGFESGNLAGWSVEGEAATVTSAGHTGGYGLEIDHTAITTTLIAQTVNVQTSWNEPTLSFLYQIPTNLSNGTFQVQLTDGINSETVLDTAAATSGWQHVWADLSEYTAEVITVTLLAEDVAGTVWLDEVTIGPWQTPLITGVSPGEWSYQEPTTLIITGSNLIETPAVFLNEIEMDDVLWVNSGRLEVDVPATIAAGSYRLTIVNPGGSRAIGLQSIRIVQPQLFLPIVLKEGAAVITADWPTLGYDALHTSYNLVDPGASRYSLAWWANMPHPGGLPLQDVVVSNNIVVATQGLAVIALDAETGTELWQQDMPADYLSPATIAYGAVYMAQDYVSSANLHTFELVSGSKYWNNSTYAGGGSYPFYAPTVAGESLFTCANLYSFNAFTGQRQWHTSWGNDMLCMPSYRDGILYVWSGDIFTPRYAHNGEAVWTLNVGDTGRTSVISGNRAILGGTTKLIGVNLDTKTIAWSFSGDYDHNIPATADGVVYSLDGSNLEARNLVNGSLLWEYPVGSGFVHGPVIAGNYVYVASEEITFVINRSTHELEWTIYRGGGLTVANGYLYVADKDGVILAYRAEEP